MSHDEETSESRRSRAGRADVADHGHVGCWHVVTELFKLAGVVYAVLTPMETPIPPIVAVDDLILDPRGASR